jgi:DNA-binding MarR family transcriptional regulator
VTRKEIHELHQALVDLVGFMNSPQRDSALLEEAGVRLDRALFPLLIAVDRKGPIGVVGLAALLGRDYTTVSRQVSKLERLGLIRRNLSRGDRRVRELVVGPNGERTVRAIGVARERMGAQLFATWSSRDLQDLARLMRRFADGLQSLPLHGVTPPLRRPASPGPKVRRRSAAAA